VNDVVHSTPPPQWLVRYVANPLLRLVVASPLGRRVPLGLLRVSGRRTGRRYAIPIGVHDVEGGMVVFSDARWMANFRGGAHAELVRGGRTVAVGGELVDDPARVGSLLREVLDAGTPPRRLGLSMPAGHRPSDQEAAAVRQAVLLTPRRA